MRAGLRSEGRRLNVCCQTSYSSPHLSFFKNVNHFFIKVKYVRACVLHRLLTLLVTARHAGEDNFKVPFNISSVLSLPESAFRCLLPTDVSYLSHT